MLEKTLAFSRKERIIVEMTVRVLVADDHSVVLAGVRQILIESGHEIVGTVADGRALLNSALTSHPDVIVLDISMPVLNGIEAAREIRAADPLVKILFLSMHTDPAYLREAFRAGANGYLIKSAALAELGEAVTEVMAGRTYVSAALARPAAATGTEPSTFGSELSTRQREVLQLVAEGKTAKDIAATLGISVKTVEYHKANIMNVLGIRTIAELTRYAVRQGITNL
jgi:DNA-binding NarL/FixJ family response regulator